MPIGLCFIGEEISQLQANIIYVFIEFSIQILCKDFLIVFFPTALFSAYLIALFLINSKIIIIYYLVKMSFFLVPIFLVQWIQIAPITTNVSSSIQGPKTKNTDFISKIKKSQLFLSLENLWSHMCFFIRLFFVCSKSRKRGEIDCFWW